MQREGVIVAAGLRREGQDNIFDRKFAVGTGSEHIPEFLFRINGRVFGKSCLCDIQVPDTVKTPALYLSCMPDIVTGLDGKKIPASTAFLEGVWHYMTATGGGIVKFDIVKVDHKAMLYCMNQRTQMFSSPGFPPLWEDNGRKFLTCM